MNIQPRSQEHLHYVVNSKYGATHRGGRFRVDGVVRRNPGPMALPEEAPPISQGWQARTV
jgi:hypothetical protein